MSEARKLLELADRVEKLLGPDRETDFAIYAATSLNTVREDGWIVRPDGSLLGHVCVFAPAFTGSLDAVRHSFPYLCVSASDIGADGLALVRLVADTSTSPIIEHTGIAPRLEHAWLAAALRARAQGEGCK